MKKDINLLTDDINSISCIKTFQDEVDENYIIYDYKINRELEYPVEIHYENNKRMNSDKVIATTDEFINGYKVVQVETGEYGYIREQDNLLLPYRFDIASNFNEYGYAMIARDGKATWLNKEFDLLSIDEEMIPYDEAINDFNRIGYQEVSNFSKGKIPLSRVYDNRRTLNRLTGSSTAFGFAYVGIDGKYKEFREYNGENLSHYVHKRFDIGRGTDFDEKGRAITSGYFLFDNGSYIATEELRNICHKENILNHLKKETKKLTKKR